MTDYKKIADTICELACGWTVDEKGNVHEYPEELQEAAVEASDAIYELIENAQRWIPVSDGLPIVSGWYWCATKRGNYDCFYYSAKHERFNCFDSTKPEDVDKYAIECIAWMPITPYKAEGDDEEAGAT